ncbi:hypothetical protein Tco_0820018 [Tanacetum coccineum]|uniref:Uncharacterized protein n=1 Tax=Tanacetum coccineum TaxID=301880 RepID=A0ABQ5A9Y7_9ASTR
MGQCVMWKGVKKTSIGKPTINTLTNASIILAIIDLRDDERNIALVNMKPSGVVQLPDSSKRGLTLAVYFKRLSNEIYRKETHFLGIFFELLGMCLFCFFLWKVMLMVTGLWCHLTLCHYGYEVLRAALGSDGKVVGFLKEVIEFERDDEQTKLHYSQKEILAHVGERENSRKDLVIDR